MKKLLTVLLCSIVLVACQKPEVVEPVEPEEEINYLYTQDIYIVTHIDSGINSLEDLKDKKIAVQILYDNENSTYVKDTLIEENGLTSDNFVESSFYTQAGFGLWSKGYDNVTIADALPVDAMIISKDVHNVMGQYIPLYSEGDHVKIVGTFNRPYLEEKDDIVDYEILQKPFAVNIIGIDERVAPNEYAHNDVNMVMVVNPKTKHMTLIGYPRDAYMTNTCTDAKDKLTHFGGGTNRKCVTNSLAKNLDIDIDYYAQVSFSSFVDLIDTVGGLTVDVPLKMCLDQNSYRDVSQPVCLEKGEQKLWGEGVLALARNRKNGVYGGDFGRIRNQQLIINSIVKKFSTDPVVINLSNLLEIHQNFVHHNFEYDDIRGLFQLVRSLGDDYTIDNYFVETSHGRDSNNLYIGVINDTSLAIAQLKAQMTLGEEISPDHYLFDEVMTGYLSKGSGSYADEYLGEEYTIEQE